MLCARFALVTCLALGAVSVPLLRLVARPEGRIEAARALAAQDPVAPEPDGLLARVPDFFFDVPSASAWRTLRAERTPPARELLAERAIPMVLSTGIEGKAGEDLHWSTAWPEPVRAALIDAIDRRLAVSWRREETPPKKRQERAWRGASWSGLEIFVVEIPGIPTGPEDLVWTVYDAGRGRVAPPVLQVPHFNENLGALVENGLFECDLDADGHLEIGFPDFRHNGTVENDSIRRYYQVEEEPLRLVEVLRFRPKQWLSMVSPGEYGYLHRVPFSRKPGELRLFVFYRNLTYGQDLLPLGEIELGRDAARGMWSPRGQSCWLPGMECFVEL
ncbi:MAG: hypothetical protein IPN34_11040 [Planctomycetes bacterium]|nr:hypothetical protein [Planctomycetota bacterium]